MNLAEFRRAVHRRSGIDYDATALTEVINEAVQAIAAEGDWPWLERVSTLTTTPGVGSYPMPTDWVRTRSMSLNGDEVPFTSVRDLDTDPTRFGFSTSGDRFTISPTPTTALVARMHYISTENTLAADADVPKLPVSYHGAVVTWAVAEAHRRRNNYKAAAVYDEAFDQWLKRIRNGVVRTTGPRRIRVRPGGAL